MNPIFTTALAAIMLAATPTDLTPGTVTHSLRGNPTTGYAWTAFIASGSCASLVSSQYEADITDEPLCGSGGTYHFTFEAVEPGESLVIFRYQRPFEPGDCDLAACMLWVDDTLAITGMDVTDLSIMTGTVGEVLADDHMVLLHTADRGDVLATFDAEESMPVEDEEIRIFTNGTMTMSIPGIVNVLYWETIPGEMARE